MSSRTDWFVHDRFGLFIHWGLYAIPARDCWARSEEQMTREQYHRYFDAFHAKNFRPREWARAARAAGQRYAVLTAKHHDGFCLFDTATTGFKAPNTPTQKDLVREYLEAFRAEGLKVGLYYSLIDWDHPEYPVSRAHPTKDGRTLRAEFIHPKYSHGSLHPLRENAEAAAKVIDFDQYLDYLHAQVRELVTNYGRLDVLWLDFSYGGMSGDVWRARELVEMIRSHQPDILLNNRLEVIHDPAQANTGYGDFFSPEQIVPDEGVFDAAGRPVPWETCLTINNYWGYNRDDRGEKSPRQLIHTLVECVAKGGNLLLNVGPNAWGEFPERSCAVLAEIGRWMDVNGESIHGAGPFDHPKPLWGCYTRRENILYAHLLERGVGPIPLRGLKSRVKRAWLLRDGAEVLLDAPLGVSEGPGDTFLILPEATLPDPIDTVVALELRD